MLIVLSATTASTDHTQRTNSALAAGLAMATLTFCFSRVSGAHANPAITVGAVIAKHVSPLRAILYICAQCGGGIAGAALVFGIDGRINDPALNPKEEGAFGMEFVLTFIIVYSFCASREPPTMPLPLPTSLLPLHNARQRTFPGQTPAHQTSTSAYGQTGTTTTTTTTTTLTSSNYTPLYPGLARADPMLMGLAHAACLVCWLASLNPARALGSAFVNKEGERFQRHWIYWVAPMLASIAAAFSYEYIFNPRRRSFSPFGSSSRYYTDPLTTLTTPGMGAGFGTVGMGGVMPGTEHLSTSYGDDVDMIDDLDRAKYKANMMHDPTFAADPTSTSYRTMPFGPKRMAGQMSDGGIYGGTRSMYNSSPYDRYDSKSGYGGYDDRNINLRRSV